MARIVYYVAASLDGFIADSAGGVDWLPDGGSDDYRYDDFYAGVQALAMGRSTYDQVRGFGEWPYPGKPAYVFTHSPPPEGPEGVRFFGRQCSGIRPRHSDAVHRDAVAGGRRKPGGPISPRRAD